MQGYKKCEILEMLASLKEANQAIEDNLIHTREDELELLTQCQQVAIAIGNHIEINANEYLYLIKVLEDYCEYIYQLSLCLADKDKSRKLIHKIKMQLNYLSEDISVNFPMDKKEVVFLPYKACMWDSLESVWKAAIEDEDYEVYVIPIPYYERGLDGSLLEMHYEGDKYPDYVPITLYNEYDFNKRKPDIIFIHNPYDEYNTITSVHPFFYSKNLKRFTDKLIYIPYFILEEVEINNKEMINNMSHFCITSGVIYSDQVIVQSDNMKRVYIEVLSKLITSAEYNFTYWNKKIQGIGSPKIDRLLTIQKENDIIIPDDWRRILIKSDGNIKKIIFYNITINALLNNAHGMMGKIKEVLAYFKECNEEIALLWRPHPLIETTIKAMRPEVWGEYKVLVEKYKSEAWGIYDDTSDLDRAIVISDAYYGDWSSIVQLYKKIGKPIMIQEIV